jgi:predicted CXXCH cytochrome family protein
VTQPLFSHPVDVRPSMPIPNAMPLERGRLACTTCHEADVNAHARSRQAHDGMLRTPGSSGSSPSTPGSAFCVHCHAGDSIGHTIGLGRAHLQWEDRSGASPADDMFGSALGLASNLHNESNDCLSCHDGGTAHDIGNSHPIGVDYRPNFTDDRTRDLVDVARLDSRIRLFSGQLGCGSCHSPYADTDMLLVIPNERGDLCKSCHDLR